MLATLATLVLVAAVPTSPAAGPSLQGTVAAPLSADEAAIRALVARYVDAREARDPAAIAALFTADADQLVSTGEWRRGREALVQGTLRSSAQTGGTRAIVLEAIRMVGSGVAIADGRYEISGLAGGSTRRMWTSFVVTFQEGAWRIAGIRNMLPAAP